MRSLSSPTSTSEAPPTLMTATPPVSLPMRSCSFSLSYSLVVFSMEPTMASTRSWISSLVPAPPMIMVSSLEIITCLAEPRALRSASSSFWPTSSDMNVAPVAIAISCIVFLLLSPKPGDLTAATLRPPRSLFTTRVARASLSTSSATRRRGFCCCMQASRKGRICCTLLIFLSTRRTPAFWNSTLEVLASVTKYGEMYPRSHLRPSTYSTSVSRLFPSETVMVPLGPSLSKMPEISPPMWPSLLAEMVATFLISSELWMGMESSLRPSTTSSTAIWMPRRRSIGFMPAATDLQPSLKIARARIVAVVVPSPASSLALDATCLTRLAPMLW
mmetsp:Transcript_24340/g.32607  ORF Transcript_24340/g.32607 Transcript_24340/m.32607 type:complete len:331 (+) Transcript_24340:677-1669(+)